MARPRASAFRPRPCAHQLSVAGEQHGQNAVLAHATRDELRVLRAIVENQADGVLVEDLLARLGVGHLARRGRRHGAGGTQPRRRARNAGWRSEGGPCPTDWGSQTATHCPLPQGSGTRRRSATLTPRWRAAGRGMDPGVTRGRARRAGRGGGRGSGGKGKGGGGGSEGGEAGARRLVVSVSADGPFARWGHRKERGWEEPARDRPPSLSAVLSRRRDAVSRPACRTACVTRSVVLFDGVRRTSLAAETLGFQRKRILSVFQ